jgi:hypothetical protein
MILRGHRLDVDLSDHAVARRLIELHGVTRTGKRVSRWMLWPSSSTNGPSSGP